MERLKVEILEGYLDGDLEFDINHFCYENEVVNVDVKKGWDNGKYIAVIQYIEHE